MTEEVKKRGLQMVRRANWPAVVCIGGQACRKRLSCGPTARRKGPPARMGKTAGTLVSAGEAISQQSFHHQHSQRRHAYSVRPARDLACYQAAAPHRAR